MLKARGLTRPLVPLPLQRRKVTSMGTVTVRVSAAPLMYLFALQAKLVLGLTDAATPAGPLALRLSGKHSAKLALSGAAAPGMERTSVALVLVDAPLHARNV